MPARSTALVVSMVLALVGAAIGAFVLVTSGRASDVNLTSAQLVPADAGVYVGLNTNLSSSQWVSAFDLVERLGEDDPEQELHDSAEDADVDWDDEVVPFLGGNASVFVRNLDIESESFSFGAILRANDAEQALEVILDRPEMEWEEDERDGVRYYIAFDGSGLLARLDDHLVFASDEDTLFDVVAVERGDEPSLADDDDFQALRDELTGNFLAFLYLNPDDLLGNFLAGDPSIREAFAEAGLEDIVFQPVAGVIGAKKHGFEFQAAAVNGGGVVTPMLEPRKSRFAGIVPGDTAVFVSTQRIAQTWDQSVEGARDKIDEAIREQGEYDSLEELFEDAGSEIGLDSVEDIITLLTGETAVAVWFPTGDEATVEGLLLAEVEDEARARDVLGAVFKESGPTRTENVTGVDVTVFEADDGTEGAWAVRDGYLMVGTLAAVTATIDGPDATLADMANYKRTLDQMPSALGSFAFFDLQGLVRLESAGVPPELDEATRALEGLIINIVDERNIVRVNGVLTIEE